MEGMDLLQGLQDAEAEAGAPQLPPGLGEFKMPSLEQMIDLVSKMDLPDEEKRQLMEGFTNKADVLAKLAGQGAERISNAMNPPKPDMFGIPSVGCVPILLLTVFVVFIFVFFGYKLYKSLVDKERKRQEKRKLRAQKKKK